MKFSKDALWTIAQMIFVVVVLVAGLFFAALYYTGDCNTLKDLFPFMQVPFRCYQG